MEEYKNTTMSIFDYLFDEGDFEIILQRIFLYLDAASLESCGLVCKRWRKFILRLFQRQVSYKEGFCIYFFLTRTRPKGAFIYDVRCFLGISDLPTYPNQILYYISLCSKIRCSLTYLPA